MRPVVSVLPPGGKGMTIRTGFAGYVCACDAVNGAARRLAAARAAAMMGARRGCIVDLPRLVAGGEASPPSVWMVRAGRESLMGRPPDALPPRIVHSRAPAG